jgi:MoaA/NifB/PqqE/SkfB family radical SAM enzyme
MKIPPSSRNQAYSVWKAAHLREKIDAIKRGELVAPQHIVVDPTGRCNHNCIFCIYRNAGFEPIQQIPREDLPAEICYKIIDEAWELDNPAFELTGGGEPLLHSEIDGILDRISKRDLELGIVTNGSLLTKGMIDRITNLKWIRVSVDAATPETYELIHRSKNFTKTLENIAQVVDRGFPDCEVGISFVIHPENINAIYAAAELFKGMGVNNIRFSYASTDKYEKLLSWSQRNRAKFLLHETKLLEDETFKVHIMETRLDDYAHGKKPFSFCGLQMFTVHVGCDGLVYPCCTVKYRSEYALGDLRTRSFGELLFGSMRRSYIDQFDPEKCPPCWHKHANQFIEYLLSEPAHVNWM